MNVIYSPSLAKIIDVCTTDDRNARGAYSGKTLEETRAKYPDAEIVTDDDATARIDEHYRQLVEPTTKEEYWEMLECLPPHGWRQEGAGTSFKMSERICGNMTTIYAEVNGKYYRMIDDIRLPHAEIMRRVLNHIRHEEAK